jgi:hypothetical protein
MGNINEKLAKIQQELKVHKAQKNTFGNYNYRSLEDIQEALKPLISENKVALVISDQIKLIGDRYYVEATASLIDCEKEDSEISVTAYARESAVKKGMDESQITGASSSYARKYALNGLFAIDDTKDADSMDNSDQGASTSFNKTKYEGFGKVIKKWVDDSKLDPSWILSYKEAYKKKDANECDKIMNEAKSKTGGDSA